MHRLRTFFTFDHLGTIPIDPEEIEGYSMWNTSNYNLVVQEWVYQPIRVHHLVFN